MVACFQHPDRDAEVVLTVHDKHGLAEFGLCHNCRHALALGCLQHERLISRDYEIVDIAEEE